MRGQGRIKTFFDIKAASVVRDITNIFIFRYLPRVSY